MVIRLSSKCDLDILNTALPEGITLREILSLFHPPMAYYPVKISCCDKKKNIRITEDEFSNLSEVTFYSSVVEWCNSEKICNDKIYITPYLSYVCRHFTDGLVVYHETYTECKRCTDIYEVECEESYEKKKRYFTSEYFPELDELNEEWKLSDSRWYLAQNYLWVLK